MKFKEKVKSEAEVRLGDFANFCRNNRKTVILICISVLLIGGLNLYSTAARNRYYLQGKEGIEALKLPEQEPGTSLPLTVEAEKDGVKTRLEVIFSLGAKTAQKERSGEKKDPEKELQSQIKALIRNLENQESLLIQLPKKTESGIQLTWKNGASSSLPAIVLLLPLCLFFLYRSQREREKSAIKAEKNGILSQLPGFNNQLLLLLSSGLIFHDAFERIARGYEERAEPGPLGQTVLTVYREALETGSSLPAVLDIWSKKMGIREFARLVNIITDNQYKGVNLSEKLESESEILWNQRKKLAEERGKAAETKLSFPLAVLLLVLILVTASPAILEM